MDRWSDAQDEAGPGGRTGVPGGVPQAPAGTVVVFGAGCAGLAAAAGLAGCGGFDVQCCDIVGSRVEELRQGRWPAHEPGLDELLRAALAARRLRFAAEADAALAGAEWVVVAVDTPPHADGSPDVGAVFRIAGRIAAGVTRPCTVIIRSAVPVGTTRRVQSLIDRLLAERRAAPPMRVVVCPPLLREGAAVRDFLVPERVVVGCDDAGAAQAMRRLLRTLGIGGERVLAMDTCSAELTQVAAHAMLAARVSFMNELALLADHAGADIEQVRRGLGGDACHGAPWLAGGLGWAGACLPQGTAALAALGRQFDCPMPLLAAVRAINERQQRWPLEVLRARWGGFAGRRVAVWGLACRPGSGDIGHSPGLWLAQTLATLGAQVCVHDEWVPVAAVPRAMDAPWCPGDDPLLAAARDAQALIVATAWPAYARVPLRRLREAMREPLVIDGRGVFEPQAMRQAGFEYLCFGRQRASAAPPPEAARQNGRAAAALGHGPLHDRGIGHGERDHPHGLHDGPLDGHLAGGGALPASALAGLRARAGLGARPTQAAG